MLPPTLKEKSFFRHSFYFFWTQIVRGTLPSWTGYTTYYLRPLKGYFYAESTRFKVERTDTQPDRTLFAQRKQSAGNSI